MSEDRSFVESNHASTTRMHNLVAGLSDDDLQRPVGAHWTIAVALVHLAFWDRRVIAVLDAFERTGRLAAPPIDVVVNDISLPIWAAVPPRQAVRIALEAAQELDERLETLEPDILELVAAYNIRFVERALHRDEHLDEVELALKA